VIKDTEWSENIPSKGVDMFLLTKVSS